MGKCLPGREGYKQAVLAGNQKKTGHNSRKVLEMFHVEAVRAKILFS